METPPMGTLTGVKVVELAGIGPGPFACMMLADMGAEVIRIDRADAVGNDLREPVTNTTLRGRRNLALDLKSKEAVATVLDLCAKADILIEGFRPGVMERLGLGPDVVMARNPRLVYGRMTGWGQDGPIAKTPGHDINYIALTGALHTIGTKAGGPVPPLNLVGDYGGGALYMVVGVLSAYIEAQRSGKGQIVDTSMVEGAASLMTPMYGALAAGQWREERESNRLDGGCHHYGVYETSDGKHICIGSNEPQFYKVMLETVGLSGEKLPAQTDREQWPLMRERLARIFKTKTRAEWTEIMEMKEICFAPVLSMSEAMKHKQNVARGTFVEVDGVPQPGPAPRFSRTPSSVPRGPAYAGEHTREVLSDWGVAPARIEALVASGAAKQR
ncbi:MAG: CaiB/BaiF CoA-transferase family protein [Hyphomicrobiaceae bacterium]|nr:CaiB/BaiF CoA-transferase family protein [Hyphomicrobiaceae bacterium]